MPAPAPIPRHIAVIMDGNGRWAKKRGMPRIFGHRSGVESVRCAVRTCARLGVEVLTLYSFSTENWRRPELEIKELMQLLALSLRKESAELDKNNVRLMACGRLHGLPEALQRELARSIEKLKKNTGLVLNLALNYGGRQEIVDAVNKILERPPAAVDEDLISRHLYTGGLPDPDLLIRTSGEFRLSNFLLWQCAYAEIYVTEILWPDFREKELLAAVEDYQSRQRRFGGI